MTNEEAISVMKSMMPPARRGDVRSTTHTLQTLAICKAIEALQERKTGKWINRTFCSNCNWYAKNRYGLATWSSFPYCPLCGAKMEVN